MNEGPAGAKCPVEYGIYKYILYYYSLFFARRTLRPPSPLQSRLCDGVFDFDQVTSSGEAATGGGDDGMTRANASVPCLVKATDADSAEVKEENSERRRRPAEDIRYED